jgi:hypothetical protein
MKKRDGVPYHGLPFPLRLQCLVCVEGLFTSSNTPEGWNAWGMDQATWLFGGTPNDPDAARIVIQQVTKDLNLDPRKVFLCKRWRFGGTSQIGITNSDLVAGIGVWADFLFVNTGTNFVVKPGVLYAGTTITPPANPISYIALAAGFKRSIP